MGSYVLDDRGPGRPRQASMWVAPGRDTRAFLHFGAGPVFATAFLQMPYGGSAFRGQTFDGSLLDGALAGLQSHFDVVDRAMLDALLMHKWDDPMLGLVGAHLLLRSDDPDIRLVHTVHDNLSGLLGFDQPDVQGVAAHANLVLDLDLPVGELWEIPMLRASAGALYHWSVVGRSRFRRPRH